jgi:hypothetical protein
MPTPTATAHELSDGVLYAVGIASIVFATILTVAVVLMRIRKSSRMAN